MLLPLCSLFSQLSLAMLRFSDNCASLCQIHCMGHNYHDHICDCVCDWSICKAGYIHCSCFSLRITSLALWLFLEPCTTNIIRNIHLLCKLVVVVVVVVVVVLTWL